MKGTIKKQPNTGAMVAYGALAAGLGVALGAFAAHGLRPALTADAYAVFDTGVRYHMYHAFGLIVAGLAGKFWGVERPMAFINAARLFGAGIILFSGSLYVLSLTQAAWVGMITPVGGLCFLAGWLVLFVSIHRRCRAD
ncbi:MAG TPA: DUF423 domain-containing protein [Bacteroidota bacterium]